MKNPEISIVIPLYNESKVFPLLVERLKKLLLESDYSIEIVMVDDGSNDDTAILIVDCCKKDTRFQGVLLSRNYGHQLALTAGLSSARGTKAIMVIDGDLQDPPELLNEFYNKIKEGYDVVYGVRKKREEGFAKKITAWAYYRFLRNIFFQVKQRPLFIIARSIFDGEEKDG